MQKKGITLKDVAKACGVSQTSVSLVMNEKECTIPLATQTRIRSVAKAMKYSPDPTARSLATKKTNTIGIIIPDIANAFFSEAVKNLQIELNRYGYDTFLCDSEELFENDVKYINLLTSRNVDGLIITMSAESLAEENQPVIKEILLSSGVPYVLFDRYFKGDDPKVVVDNTTSGYEVAKHLIEMGHTKIGVITGPLSLNSSRNRLNGVMKALQEANLSLEPDHVVYAKYDMESGRIGARHLLGKVTAIFAFNDLQAYGVIETAHQQHLSIPEDISLIGFDDIFYSSILETKLTTVRQPIKEMAIEISKLLIELIKHPSKGQVIRMPAQLIIRDSVKKQHGWMNHGE